MELVGSAAKSQNIDALLRISPIHEASDSVAAGAGEAAVGEIAAVSHQSAKRCPSL